MKTPQEIQADLRNFTGTESYFRFSAIMRNFVLTDGTKYLAEECGCYWLMDLVASHRHNYKDEGFVVAKMKKDGKGCLVRLEDGNDNILAKQHVEYTDFPLEEITLYVCRQGDLFVILLPSEY